MKLGGNSAQWANYPGTVALFLLCLLDERPCLCPQNPMLGWYVLSVNFTTGSVNFIVDDTCMGSF
jgi:hypothetical protein